MNFNSAMIFECPLIIQIKPHIQIKIKLKPREIFLFLHKEVYFKILQWGSKSLNSEINESVQ